MPRGVGRDLGNDESVTLVGEAVEEIPVPIQRPDAERPGEDTAEESGIASDGRICVAARASPNTTAASAKSSHCS
jgi:hypothetical protein